VLPEDVGIGVIRGIQTAESSNASAHVLAKYDGNGRLSETVDWAGRKRM